MAPHSSTLAWKIPWVVEPGRLQSMGSLRIRHDWATSLSLFTFMHWRRKWHPHSSTLAWRIPGMGEPGWLTSMGLHRAGHHWSDLAAAAGNQGSQQTPYLPSLLAWPRSPVSPRKVLVHTVGTPDFGAAIGGTGPRIAWHHSSQGFHFPVHRTTAHKEEVLNGYKSYQPCAYTHRPSTERTGKKSLPSFSLEGF